MVSYTDGEKIKAVWDEISKGGETNWLALKYVDKEEFDISGSGSGGYEEFIAHLPEDDIIFGGFRVYGLDEEGLNPRTKLITVAYVPSGVKGLKRARAGPHKGEVLKVFHGFHISVEANAKDDLDVEVLEKKLNLSTGSHQPASYTWKQQ